MPVHIAQKNPRSISSVVRGLNRVINHDISVNTNMSLSYSMLLKLSINHCYSVHSMNHKAYKTELDPNDGQIGMFRQHAGTARFVYNWALSKKIEMFGGKGKIPSSVDLNREITQLKKSEYSWMNEVSSTTPTIALQNVDRAFDGFFRRCKRKVKGPKGFPKFKSKKLAKARFQIAGRIHIYSSSIKLPKIGIVRLKESDYIPTDLKILSATISEKAGRWYVSVLCEEDIKPLPPASIEVLGIDLGIKSLATCSDGTVYGNIKALNSNFERLKRKQRILSRRQRGSKNREKAKKRLSILHHKIHNIRVDVLHKATTSIVQRANVLVLEDLNVKGMMSNRSLAKAISDVGLYEFRRQIEYKAKWYGREVIFADRFYPSSKLCSVCGSKKENLTLSDRVYECDECGQVSDRDMNAAINLRKYYQSKNTVGYTGINACGDERYMSLPLRGVDRCSSMKQESTICV